MIRAGMHCKQVLLSGGCFSLRAEDLRFGLEPVLDLVAVFAAALFVELVGAATDLFFPIERDQELCGLVRSAFQAS